MIEPGVLGVRLQGGVKVTRGVLWLLPFLPDPERISPHPPPHPVVCLSEVVPKLYLPGMFCSMNTSSALDMAPLPHRTLAFCNLGQQGPPMTYIVHLQDEVTFHNLANDFDHLNQLKSDIMYQMFISVHHRELWH